MSIQNQTTSSAETATVAEQDKTQAPKGWIRWSGLVSFLVIVGAVVAVSYLALTLVLKSQIEKYASQAWGAKISMTRLDLGLFPLRVYLNGLQVTDPKQPMHNLVEIGNIGASLNFYQWVAGRTVIDQVKVTNLAFNQLRMTSGALEVKAKPEQKATDTNSKSSDKASGFKVPNMMVPKPDEILSRQTFKTTTKAKEIEQNINQLNQQWSDLQKQLPDSKVLADYQKRFEALMQGKINNLADIQAKQKALESLQSDANKKMDAINAGRKLLQTSLPKLQADVATLKSLPAQDFAQLSQTYSLNQSGFENLTYLIFGPKIQSLLQQGLSTYDKLKPFIEKANQMMAKSKAQKLAEQQAEQQKRQAGRDIAFKEFDPQPSFIIKRVEVSTKADAGQFSLTMQNINFNQSKSHMPTLFSAQLQPQGQPSALTIQGQSNWIVPNKGFTQATISWPNYQIQHWALMQDDTLPLMMNQSKVNVSGEIVLAESEALTGKVNLAYQQVDMDVSQSQSAEVKRYIAPIFKEIHQFTVQANLSGKLFAPQIGAKSDLDKLLSSAMNKVLSKEMDAAKADLKKQFDKQMAQQLAPINQQLSKLLGEQAQLTADSKGLEQLLATKPETLAKQEQAKLEKQAQDKINAEKQRLQAEAQKKADEEKKRLEESAKKEQQKLQDQLLKQFKF